VLLPTVVALLGKESLMLVLTRHAGEKIVLPGLGITIQVLAVKRGGVRIGVDAPPEVPVLREELADARRSFAPPLGQRSARELCPV
jgi:carbon storage regulator CsrA